MSAIMLSIICLMMRSWSCYSFQRHKGLHHSNLGCYLTLTLLMKEWEMESREEVSEGHHIIRRVYLCRIRNMRRKW